LLRYGDFSTFQSGGCLPSWISCACIWTTHKGHLVVFNNVQNLVGINAALSAAAILKKTKNCGILATV